MVGVVLYVRTRAASENLPLALFRSSDAEAEKFAAGRLLRSGLQLQVFLRMFQEGPLHHIDRILLSVRFWLVGH